MFDMASKNWQKLQARTGEVANAGETVGEFMPIYPFSSMRGFGHRSELLDDEDEPYFSCGNSDMSVSELDVFLEENGYETDPASYETGDETDPGSDGSF